MRSFLSVFGLAARTSFYKCIGAILAAAAVETGVFYYCLKTRGQALRLEEILDQTVFCLTPILGMFFLLSILYETFHTGKGSGSFYTIARLSAGRKEIAAACSLYNICILLLSAATQLLLFYLFCQWYIRQTNPPDAIHVTFLAFMRSKVIFSFLPLYLPLHLIKNLIVLITVSMTAAAGAAGFQFRGIYGYLTFIVIFTLRSTSAISAIGLISGSLAAAGILIYKMLRMPLSAEGSDAEIPGGADYA